MTTNGVHKLYRRDNQPFAQIPNEAIRDPRITPTGFRLLAYLMSHQDGYELTYGQIERQTGMGRYAINEAIKNLEGLGWLQTEATKMANGQFGPKSWTVLDPATVGNSTAGDSTTEKPTDNKNKTSIEDKDKEFNISSKSEMIEAFDQFWTSYPRKAGKGAAKRAFAKAYAIAGLEVVAGCQRFAADPNLPFDKTFIPHPATWLNAERWEDEPLPERELTAEEKAMKARQRSERERAAAIEASRLVREESERRRAELEANPVTRCEHGRVAVMCPKCSPIR